MGTPQTTFMIGVVRASVFFTTPSGQPQEPRVSLHRAFESGFAHSLRPQDIRCAIAALEVLEQYLGDYVEGRPNPKPTVVPVGWNYPAQHTSHAEELAEDLSADDVIDMLEESRPQSTTDIEIRKAQLMTAKLAAFRAQVKAERESDGQDAKCGASTGRGITKKCRKARRAVASAP
jgi:hypothetical protein